MGWRLGASMLRAAVMGCGPVRVVGRLGLMMCLSATAACVGQAAPPLTASSAPRQFDRPAPAEAARSEAGYIVDLTAAADCELQFDLQAYRDKRVELVHWDAQDGCNDRSINVRYLSATMPEQTLFELIKKLARSVERQPKR